MKGERTREYILKKASELFKHFGFYKTAIDDIASEARVGKGTIYYYFRSKYELFAEVIVREGSKLLSLLRSNVESVNAPEEKVLKASLEHVKYLRKNSLLLETLSDEKLLAIPDIYGAIKRFRSSVSQFFRELLDACREGSDERCDRISPVLADLLTTIALTPPHIYRELSDENIAMIVKAMLKGADQWYQKS